MFTDVSMFMSEKMPKKPGFCPAAAKNSPLLPPRTPRKSDISRQAQPQETARETEEAETGKKADRRGKRQPTESREAGMDRRGKRQPTESREAAGRRRAETEKRQRMGNRRAERDGVVTADGGAVSLRFEKG
jgi:hypothetical protein